MTTSVMRAKPLPATTKAIVQKAFQISIWVTSSRCSRGCGRGFLLSDERAYHEPQRRQAEGGEPRDVRRPVEEEERHDGAHAAHDHRGVAAGHVRAAPI